MLFNDVQEVGGHDGFRDEQPLEQHGGQLLVQHDDGQVGQQQHV